MKICLNCKIQFKPKPYRAERARFCSLKCRSSLTAEQKFLLIGWEVRPNGCWDWRGSADSTGGYAIFVLAGERIRAHRFSWERVNGPFPDRLHGLHSCDNRICVNPEHTFPGTDADNVADMDEKGRRRILRGSENGESKLTENDILAIRASADSGTDLAIKFKVSPSAISLARRRKTWRHVN